MSHSTERAGGEPDDSNVTPFPDIHTETGPKRLGDQLMSARLGKGLEIEDIARQLHIRREYLEALEAGRFEDIPGATYVAGFLRSYANFLRLDGGEMVRAYKDESGGALVRQDLYFPIPASEARRPTGGMIVIALLIAVVALALWYVVSERQFVDLELVPPVPEFLDESSEEDRAALAAQEAQSAAGATEVATLFTEEPDTADDSEGAVAPDEPLRETPDAVTEDAAATEIAAPDEATDASTGVDEEPAAEMVQPSDEAVVTTSDDVIDSQVADSQGADRQAADDEEAMIDSEADLAAVAVDESYVPRVYGRTNADSRIEIRAIDTSWVQIEAPGSQVLLTRVLLPGDVYRVPNGDGITLKTGNAGGLEVRVDGELIDPLGEPGKVVKNVALDPDQLLQR